MNILSLGTKLFHADGRTDRQTDRQTAMMKLIVSFRNIVNWPENSYKLAPNVSGELLAPLCWNYHT